MEFEWDESKRLGNLQKHGIDFLRAIEVFEYAYWETRSDTPDENRWKAIGQMNNEIIAVIYTFRGDVVRIISARKARRNERREYQALYH